MIQAASCKFCQGGTSKFFFWVKKNAYSAHSLIEWYICAKYWCTEETNSLIGSQKQTSLYLLILSLHHIKFSVWGVVITNGSTVYYRHACLMQLHNILVSDTFCTDLARKIVFNPTFYCLCGVYPITNPLAWGTWKFAKNSETISVEHVCTSVFETTALTQLYTHRWN